MSRRGDGAEPVVEAFAADPDRCAAEAYAEERRTIGPDHGALAAGRTVLALSLAEPLEKIEIQLGGHMADGSAVENRFQGDARPILRVHPFDFLSAALDTHMARRAGRLAKAAANEACVTLMFAQMQVRGAACVRGPRSLKIFSVVSRLGFG